MVVNFSYTSHDDQSFCGQKSWIANFFVDDAVEYFFLIIAWKRRLKSTNHNTANNTLHHEMIAFNIPPSPPLN